MRRELLEKLVDVFAVLSFSPGGVTLFGAHFDATLRAEMDATCDECTVQGLAAVFSRRIDEPDAACAPHAPIHTG